MKKQLRKAIMASFGVAAMAGFSNQASADLSFANLGTFTGSTITASESSPYKAFTDYAARNQGWMHTAKFLVLSVGTPGTLDTYNIQLQMTSRGAAGITAASAMDNPSFALWALGTNSFSSSGGGQHGWNPTRGPNETGVDVNGTTTQLYTNARLMDAGVLDGHAGWIGYVNSGPTYTLINKLDPLNSSAQTESGAAVNDLVGHGGVNTTSLSWLTNPGASSTSYTNDYYRSGSTMIGTQDSATMTLFGLKAGNYLIATGGSCPSPTPVTSCGQGAGYTFTVSTAPVPVPAAVWLFGSALAGMGVISRKRKAA